MLIRRILAVLAIAFLSVGGESVSVQAAPFQTTYLVTNNQAAHPAQITDGNLQNAWGVSHSSASPFWVSDNRSGVSTLYRVNPVTNATTIVPLVVSIPGDGSVTGQAFNAAAAT